MIKKIISVVLFCFFVHTVFCQDSTKTASTKEQKKQARRDHINELIKKYEEGSLVYNKQSAFAFKLNTNGCGAFSELGKYKTIDLTNLYWIEIGEIKDRKEEKVTPFFQNGPFLISGNPYIYGKQNNFYFAKLGIGQQRLIGSKGNKNGVAVSGIYGAGLSAALVKPYYLQIQDPFTGVVTDERYHGPQDSIFIDPNAIIGGSGFGKGFSEIKFTPGFHAKAALRFDYGQYNELLSAVEVGLNADYYTKNIPILINTTGKKFFFSAYVAIEVGKRK